ncbi:hypothetical protein KY290_005587 [Solanum tuberosum]|uniref:Uncharacterized protein n=1 Tax=Solanum tuberosum TaxID=4113 RepID=A0ABQ7WGN6_SOLTU|nr:hypothetical protein KY284_024736 [Solanum tuberosum]KAH0697131.1 hypothetical protein KY289_014613 [Solanum tuberosum]KAH0752305.1 hypothetical protein KY285_005453 [Solanum tuberosum]KAH0779160.1 hypothetical protein KY290_005587 [Solanum tuberosum]
MAVDGVPSANTDSTSNGTSSHTLFPVIDHNHPLFLQHTETPDFLSLCLSLYYMISGRSVTL